MHQTLRTDNKDRWARLFARSFLGVWIPLTLVLAVVTWTLYRTQQQASLKITRNTEQQTITLAVESVASELDTLRGDVLYLSKQSSLGEWLKSGSPSAKQRLTADFLAFATNRRLYDQVRFIDERGREIVRVNWNNGKPTVVPDDKLQNKADRYYVRDALAQGRGAVYVSPFDLNIEHHAIERPIKPMIRLGTPVFGPQGRKRGIVVLNYLGRRLLDRVKAIPDQNNHGLWLLNAKGYWLLGPSKRREWGFMYPKRAGTRFADSFGAVWSAIQKGPAQSQFILNGDMFTYARMPLADSFGREVGTKHWVLVSRVPHSVLAANTAGDERSLGITFIVTTSILGLVSLIIAYYGLRRRQSEAAVRASEIRFRSLVNAAPDALVIVGSDGRIRLVNSQAENWFGYTREELLGQPVERLVPNRLHERHRDDRDKYLADPTARPMGVGTELHAVRKDGSEFPVEISLSPVETEQGTLIISIVRDITSRTETERARHAAEAQYRELVDNLPVGVYRKTPGKRGRFLEVNPAMVDILEADSANELLARHVQDMYSDPADEERFSEDVMRRGYVNGQELCLRSLRGRQFQASMSAVAKRDASGDVYFDGIVEDISLRKESEERIERLNEKLSARAAELELINGELEAFSYSVSHDLRAPLRAIDGFSRILLDDYADKLDEKGKDRLKRVRAASQRMAALIDDILGLSRVSRAELHREPVDLSTLAEEVVDTLRKAEPSRAVEVAVQPGLTVEGDKRLLRVALDNLLNNAWKFTGGQPNARIELGGRVDGGAVTHFVRDNGAGFDMAYADKLFGAFQRLHDANEFPGTGIGLATVQRVVHKHGGRVWAESAPGAGATFYFTLQPAEAL